MVNNNFNIFKLLNIILFYLFLKLSSNDIIKILYWKSRNIKKENNINVINFNTNKNEKKVDYNKTNEINRGIFEQRLNNISENKRFNISISYSTDNKYIYPIIVSMISLVINASNKTFYNIYILHTPDFSETSKHFLKTIEKKYPDKCLIIYINMGDKYNKLQLSYKLSTPAYYRLSLPDILPEINRIIYLDGDTLVFEDLKELVQFDMKGNVIMGFLDRRPYALQSFGFKKATVICSGVLLIDLDGLRKYGYSKKIKDFIDKNKKKLVQHDQTIINVVMQGRISPLPPKYGIWGWRNKITAKNHLKRQWPELKYNETEYLYALDHPAIIHYAGKKPFWRQNTAFNREWWNLARLTGYYDDIYLKSPIKKKKKVKLKYK